MSEHLTDVEKRNVGWQAPRGAIAGPTLGFVQGAPILVVFSAGLPRAERGPAGTWFWIDPTNEVIFVDMIQRMLTRHVPLIWNILRANWCIRRSYTRDKHTNWSASLYIRGPDSADETPTGQPVLMTDDHGRAV
jgi:CubicO group peptidase (beta-lactamase class C family)